MHQSIVLPNFQDDKLPHNISEEKRSHYSSMYQKKTSKWKSICFVLVLAIVLFGATGVGLYFVLYPKYGTPADDNLGSGSTLSPTVTPTVSPTTIDNTYSPSTSPIKAPSSSPTFSPVAVGSPTRSPTTPKPSISPSAAPTKSPTRIPTTSPTNNPTPLPTTSSPTPADDEYTGYNMGETKDLGADLEDTPIHNQTTKGFIDYTCYGTSCLDLEMHAYVDVQPFMTNFYRSNYTTTNAQKTVRCKEGQYVGATSCIKGAWATCNHLRIYCYDLAYETETAYWRYERAPDADPNASQGEKAKPCDANHFITGVTYLSGFSGLVNVINECWKPLVFLKP